MKLFLHWNSIPELNKYSESERKVIWIKAFWKTTKNLGNLIIGFVIVGVLMLVGQRLAGGIGEFLGFCIGGLIDDVLLFRKQHDFIKKSYS